jgi:hypothetical protein
MLYICSPSRVQKISISDREHYTHGSSNSTFADSACHLFYIEYETLFNNQLLHNTKYIIKLPQINDLFIP